MALVDGLCRSDGAEAFYFLFFIPATAVPAIVRRAVAQKNNTSSRTMNEIIGSPNKAKHEKNSFVLFHEHTRTDLCMFSLNSISVAIFSRPRSATISNLEGFD